MPFVFNFIAADIVLGTEDVCTVWIKYITYINDFGSPSLIIIW